MHHADAKPVLDVAFFEESCGGDMGFQSTLLGAFADSADELIPKMVEACAATDTAGLGARAHRLKGAALTIGAVALADALLRLERAADAGLLDEARHALPHVLAAHRTLLAFTSERNCATAA